MNGINYMTHMNSNSNGYNYRSSYIQNTPSINQTNYTNKNTTLHNNLNENIELEQIEILNVLIDGYHRRNHTSEVNPYKFIVDFGQEPKLEETVGNITTKINPKGIYLNYGDRGLSRVKSVKFTSLCVPKYTTYTYDDSGYKFDGGTILKTDVRYVTLKIKELVDIKKITSGDFMNNTSITFRYDKDLGSLSHYYIPMMNDTITYQIPITNLKRFTVNLYDDTDTQLELPTLTYDDYANGGTSRTRTFDFDTILSELEAVKAANGLNPFSNISGNSTDINTTIAQVNALKRRHQIQIYLDIGISTKAMNKITDYNQ